MQIPVTEEEEEEEEVVVEGGKLCWRTHVHVFERNFQTLSEVGDWLVNSRREGWKARDVVVLLVECGDGIWECGVQAAWV